MSSFSSLSALNNALNEMGSSLHGLAWPGEARRGAGRRGAGRRGAAMVAVAVAALLVVGCEKKTDEKLSAETAKGATEVASGRSSEAVSTLASAAAMQAAPGATLAAKFTLGHAKADLAAQSSTQLDAVNLEIARLISEIAQVGQSVAVGNTLVDGYRKQDPADARARIRERLAEAQGSAGKDVWVDTGKNPIPTLAAARQKLSAAQEAVSAKQAQIRQLTDKRKAALGEADELRAKVDPLTGRAQVDAFARAADARKAVSLVSSDIDLADGELAILTRTQQIAEGQVTVVERYIAHLQTQDKAITAGFEAVGIHINSQIAVSKGAAEAPAEGELAASIAAKAQLLSAKFTEAEKLHGETEKLLTEAAAEYQGAFSEAGRLRAELQERIARAGDLRPFTSSMLSSLQKTTSPTDYRLQQGLILAKVANLRARRAEVLGSKQGMVAALAPAFEKLDIKLPDSLQGDLAAGPKSSRDAASDTFTKASQEFEGVAGGIQGSDADASRRRNAVATAQMYLMYNWSQFLAASGDTAGAAEKLASAIGFRDQLISDGKVKLPTLPGELMAAPAVATEPPATAP